MQTQNAQWQMIEHSKIKLEQILQTLDNNKRELNNLTESLREDYLTRAYAFAYIIEQNAEVLNSMEELKRIKALLNVDELHVIDENGILFAGTIPKYYGMDFRSTTQTNEFLFLLDNPNTYLIQDIQPNGAEGKLFQYVGVARRDVPGIVQVGFAPIRQLEAQKRNQIDYVLSRVTVDAKNFLFAIDIDKEEIVYHSNLDFTGKKLSELEIDIEGFISSQDKEHVINKKQEYYVWEQYDNLIIGIGTYKSELYKERMKQTIFVAIFLVIICIIVILAINYMLKKVILDGIHSILQGLNKITEGNLDSKLQVTDNPEFQKLSVGINKMVDSILNSTVKVSRVIDIVDLPIGVFEFHKDMERVIATERLRHVMLWSEEEARVLYQDKSKFLAKLDEMKKIFQTEYEDIYKIGENPERWIQIYGTIDIDGTFGVVTDITNHVLEKQILEHERDHDKLTNLKNFYSFKKQVEVLIECKEDLKTAAIVMLDLDCFKGINDNYGHDWGDEYLKICAGFLSAFNGKNGFAARRSGDEFCLFLYKYQSREALLMKIQEFYTFIEKKPILFPDGSYHTLKISSGLAWYLEKDDYNEIMKKADQALYNSKNNGKGMWCQAE